MEMDEEYDGGKSKGTVDKLSTLKSGAMSFVTAMVILEWYLTCFILVASCTCRRSWAADPGRWW